MIRIARVGNPDWASTEAVSATENVVTARTMLTTQPHRRMMSTLIFVMDELLVHRFILRDAMLRRAPQDEVRGIECDVVRSDRFHGIDPLIAVKIESCL